MLLFWVVTPCGLIGRCHYVSPKLWYLPTSPHGVTTQKNNIDFFTAVRTSNLR
jgi:hypothetical protein